MISVAVHVGRLIECRVIAPLAPEDLASAEAAWTALPPSPTERRMLCMDLRRAPLLTAEAWDAMSAMLHRMLERSPVQREVWLLPAASPTFTIQMKRLSQSMESSTRRLVHDDEAAMEWLGAVLTLTERSQLRVLLRESLARTALAADATRPPMPRRPRTE